MITSLEDFEKVAKGFREQRDEYIEKLKNVKFQDIFALTDSVIASQKLVKTEGIASPTLIAHVHPITDKVTDISIRTAKNVGLKYKTKNTFDIDENIVEHLSKVVSDTAIEVVRLQFAENNLGIINQSVAQACKESGCGYSVSFTCLSDAKYYVAGISDKGVVISVPVEKGVDVSTVPLVFDKDDEFSRLVANQAYSSLISDLMLSQTPVQFIKSKSQLLANMIGGTTKVSASNLLRGTYHKKAQFAKTGSVGYVTKDNWFALLKNNGDGTYETVLSPFDKRTLITLTDVNPEEVL